MFAEETEPSTQAEIAPANLTGRLCAEARRYQRALERNPRDPEALAGASLVALASGHAAAAVLMARAAVAIAPAMNRAWVALGQALRAEHRDTEAEEAYEAALRIDGLDPLARLGLGELKLAAGRAGEAIGEFELALRRDPALVSAYLGMSNALVFLKRYDEASEYYDRASQLRPQRSETDSIS